MKKIGNVLIVGSSPFFLGTALEMYVLTVIRGPQMIGFSMAHIAPGLFILMMLSGLFYLCLATFALVLVVMKLLRWPVTEARYIRLMLIVLSVQIVHTSLLLTYDYWSPVVFGKGA
jgi:hypothetical protein